MKNLSIEVTCDDGMNEMQLKTNDNGFTSCEFSFVVYKILKRLYKLRKNATLIAVTVFIDDLKHED